MKITTSKGNEYDVLFIEGPSRITGHVVIMMPDSRSLSEICPEFDGLEWIRADDGREWNGYTDVAVIARPNVMDVRISLSKNGG